MADSSGMILRRRVIFGILAVCFQMTKVIWAQDTSTDIHNSEKQKSKYLIFYICTNMMCINFRCCEIVILYIEILTGKCVVVFFLK